MSDAHLAITDPRVEEYLVALAASGGSHGLPDAMADVLKVMEEYADGISYPIVGPLLGRMLCLFAGLTGAKRIFDAGCGFGYSATWLAAGAGAGANLTCVDFSQDNLGLARENHRRAGLRSSFDYRYGDAVATLEQEVGPYDIVFSDVDKQYYPRMAELAADRLRPGGLYIADNALWHGKVCSGTVTRDAWTASVDAHNHWLFGNDRFFAALLDQHNGLLVAVKRPD